MPYSEYGRYSQADAPTKNSTRPKQGQFTNNITRRNAELTECHPNVKPSTSLQSANIKALRLFRQACRLIPFILKIHQMQHQVTPVQSKRYLANWFRKYSKQSNLNQIDFHLNYCQQCIYEAQMHYVNSGYIFKYLLPPTHKKRDHGVNYFYERHANQIRKQDSTKFLSNFYRGDKSHNI